MQQVSIATVNRKGWGHQKSKPSELSNKHNSNFVTCLVASPVAIGFLCLLVVTPVRSVLSLCCGRRTVLQVCPASRICLSSHASATLLGHMTALIYTTNHNPCKPLLACNQSSCYMSKSKQAVSQNYMVYVLKHYSICRHGLFCALSYS